MRWPLHEATLPVSPSASALRTSMRTMARMQITLRAIALGPWAAERQESARKPAALSLYHGPV